MNRRSTTALREKKKSHRPRDRPAERDQPGSRERLAPRRSLTRRRLFASRGERAFAETCAWPSSSSPTPQPDFATLLRSCSEAARMNGSGAARHVHFARGGGNFADLDMTRSRRSAAWATESIAFPTRTRGPTSLARAQISRVTRAAPLKNPPDRLRLLQNKPPEFADSARCSATKVYELGLTPARAVCRIARRAAARRSWPATGAVLPRW